VKEHAPEQRWQAKPVWSAVIRIVAFLVPIIASIAFVNLASRAVAMPTSSLWLFLAWWIALSAAATGVLLVVDQLARRLLPLAALFKLSLVFPDRAPSRFETALRTGTVESLEGRLAEAKKAGKTATPVEAAKELLSLVALLDQHDKLTRGHCERVRAYAQTIAQELRLSETDRDLLNWAALLHDVGKLGVPTEVLQKPGKPTDEEWELLKQHPEIGEELVAPLEEWLGEWATGIGDHHERWDGRGYPLGKSGTEISLSGRIISVADVFDVITSSRSYKSAYSTAQARSELAAHAHTQFDERVVRAFLNVGLGRLRLIMGPLSWLAHAPILGRMPLTPAVGALTGTVASVAAAATAGLVHGPPPSAPPTRLAAVSAHVQPVSSSTHSSTHSDPDVPRAPQGDASEDDVQKLQAASAPVAPSLEWTLDEDSKAIVHLEGLEDPDALERIRIIEPPHFGEAAVTGHDAVAYTPPRDFSGATSLGYEACWRDGDCAAAYLSFTVVPVNDLPSTQPDAARTDEDEPVRIDVLANDGDVEDSPLDAVAAWGATAGQPKIADGRIAYRPPPDFNGTATFLYAVADEDGGTSVDRVTVDVAAVNDAPVAAADRATTDEDVPVTIAPLANDWDRDGDKLVLLAVDPPANGTVTTEGSSLEYMPPADFAGAVHYTYTVTDHRGGSEVGSVDLDVVPVNDAPRPGADAASVDIGHSVEIQVLANDRDPEGDALTLLSVTAPSNGTATVDGDGVRFTAPDAPGTASFQYVVRDSRGATARGTVTVDVFGVNSAPSFVAGPNQGTDEDTGAQSAPGWATAISPGRPDESAQTVSFVVTTDNPALFAPDGRPTVSVNGTLTYTPAPNANGVAGITVRAHDNGGTAVGGVDVSAPQTRTITVAAVNDAPSAQVGADQTVLEDAGAQTVGGWATAMSPGPPDESGQSVSLVVTTPNSSLFAAGGQPDVTPNGTLTYTPATNANGVATVTARAHDNGGTARGGVDTGTAETFTITISSVNDAPAAADDTASVDEDGPAGVTFNVLANDSDADGDALSITSFDASTVTAGTLTDDGGGQFTFTPEAAYNGVQSFTYTAGDGHGATDAATVEITVVSKPDAPTAADDAYATTQGTAVTQAAPGVLANDSDEDGDGLTLETTPVVAPGNGSLSLSPNGAFTYTPAAGFVGRDSFTYRVDDGTGRSGDATATITVAAVTNTTTLFYLGTSGSSGDVWDLTTSAPAAASPVPDFDGDGSPGLTIAHSSGDASVTVSSRWQAWTRTSATPLVLNGPVVLGLWSTVEAFDANEGAHPHVYLYDCVAGGTGCLKIASNHVHVSSWNGGVSDWVYHEITVGSVTGTIAVGHELRIKLLTSQNNLWIAMTAAYPSTLAVVTGL
jgi:VCBS repeat-containing protein